MFKDIFNPLARRVERYQNRKKLERVLAAFKKIELGRKMLAWAEDNGVEIRLYELSGRWAGTCSHSGKYVELDSKQSLEKTVEVLAHELRHSWQNMGLDNNDYIALNPFSRTIQHRFTEADAYSFNDMFMLKYISALNPQETELFIEANPEMYAVLMTLKQQAGDNDVNIRHISFENYFTSKIKDIYDENWSEDRWFLREYQQKLICQDPEKFKVKEKSLIALGNSAWGECDGLNFLEPDGKAFDVTKGKYIDAFNSVALDNLRNANRLSYYQGLNAIQMKNGQQRPLIRLDR